MIGLSGGGSAPKKKTAKAPVNYRGQANNGTSKRVAGTSRTGSVNGSSGTAVAKAGKQNSVKNVTHYTAPKSTPKTPARPTNTDTADVNAQKTRLSALKNAQLAARQKKATKAAAPVADLSTPGAFDGLTPSNLAAALGAAGGSGKKARNMQSYIAEALADLGPGTDYSGLAKQLNADSKNADSKIAQMYSALTLGIRSNDPVLKGIYDDAASQISSAGANAQSTVRGAYDNAATQVAQRLGAVGADPNSTSAQFAAGDEAAAETRMAGTTNSDLGYNAGMEAASRAANVGRATNAGFAGAEARSQLAQQLADQQAQLQTKQSTENSSRRAQALQYAISLQNSDQSAANASQQLALKMAQMQFDQQLAIAKGKQSQAALSEKTANDAATQTLNSQKATTSAQQAADAQAIKLKQIELQTAGQSKSRQASALATAYNKGGINYDQYQKAIKALG